jgi:hypothetical protein
MTVETPRPPRSRAALEVRATHRIRVVCHAAYAVMGRAEG